MAAHGSLRGKIEAYVRRECHSPITDREDSCKTRFDFQMNFKISLTKKEQWMNIELMLEGPAEILHKWIKNSQRYRIHVANPGINITASMDCTVFQSSGGISKWRIYLMGLTSALI